MGKKGSVAQFFDDAVTSSHKLLLEIELNNDNFFEKLEGSTEINHKRILDFWDKWGPSQITVILHFSINRTRSYRNRYARRTPDANLCDMKTVKHFIKGVARGCFINKKSPPMHIVG